MQKNGKNYFLRIYIDKQDGINLEDCEKVNNEITEELDNVDYIKEQYFLEVSSPGIERVIRKDWQLNKYINKEINIKLFKKDDQNKKEYQGLLQKFDDNSITIKDEENEVVIERKNISLIKLVYKW